MHSGEYIYPARLEQDEDDAFVLSFPDVPEALTGDASKEVVMMEATDCLLAALESYIKAREPIPLPSSVASGYFPVRVPPLAAAKLALYQATLERDWSNVRLGQEIQLSESQVRRLFDLRHRSSIDAIDAYLRAMGKRLAITTHAAE